MIAKPACHKHIKILIGIKLEPYLCTTPQLYIGVADNFSRTHKMFFHIFAANLYDGIFSQW